MTATHQRIGDWMQTYTGVAFWPLDPRVEEINISDIAHALANTCRYGGHCTFHYSVAQHSVLLSKHVAPEHALWALLHDATEAYLVDVPRPVKRFLTGYREIEDRLMAVIAERFGLYGKMPDAVKDADNRILLDESARLLGPAPMPWGIAGKPLGVAIKPWSPLRAEDQFLIRFGELTI